MIDVGAYSRILILNYSPMIYDLQTQLIYIETKVLLGQQYPALTSFIII